MNKQQWQSKFTMDKKNMNSHLIDLYRYLNKKLIANTCKKNSLKNIFEKTSSDNLKSQMQKPRQKNRGGKIVGKTQRKNLVEKLSEKNLSKKLNMLNKNGIPFHDRERITNFQKYHENITVIFQIEK